MSNEILSSIYSFSKEFIDPVSNLSFKPENKNISAIVKNGHINITLTISDSNHEKFIQIIKIFHCNQLGFMCQQICQVHF